MNNERIKKYWQPAKPYVEALSIYLASRAVIGVAIFFAHKFVPPNPHGGFWNVSSSWYRFLLRYDSGWYLTIATKGYTFAGDEFIQQPVAFYPLYPLLARALSIATRMDINIAILVISNLAALIAIPFFYRLLLHNYSREVSLAAVALLSFFPTSIFFSTGYTESLSFLLIVITFLLLHGKRFWLAAVAAGFATGTRSTGILLLLPIIWEAWRNTEKMRWQFFASIAGYCAIASAGLWLFMIFLWVRFGSPLVFATNLTAWEAAGQRNDLLAVLTLQPFYEHLVDIQFNGPMPNALDPWVFLAFVALLIFFRRRIPGSYLLFALGVLLLPYFTRSGGSLGFLSFMRYMLLAFPVFVILGELVANRLPALVGLLSVLVAFLFMYTAMFAQWYWIG